MSVYVKNHDKKSDVAEEDIAEDVPPQGVAGLADMQGHWAKENVMRLMALGIAKGYPDGTFKPDNTITRAEFVTMLVKAFNLEGNDGKVYIDTSGHWAASSIAAASYHGAVKGYSQDAFGPDDPVTREQMAVITARVAKLVGNGQPSDFTDSSEISEWAVEAVSAIVEKGIMGGYPDKAFRAKRKATRAEAATVLINVLNTRNQ